MSRSLFDIQITIPADALLLPSDDVLVASTISPSLDGDGNLSISPTPASFGYPSRTKLKRRLSQTISPRSIIQLGSEKSSRSGIKSSVNWDLGLPRLCGLHGTWSFVHGPTSG
ncbi:hypothetical protein N7470_000385 [Penicillium chermesinum]|nr:hypothetical protein N7470_000385 [Penicillium chermesinum]